MNVINFPKQKPRPGQFELPRAQIAGLTKNLSDELTKLSLNLMTAESAEEFAKAIADVHAKLSEASFGFAQFADSTRHWR